MPDPAEALKPSVARYPVLSIGVGLAVSGFFLWWAVRGLNLSEIVALVTTAPKGPVVLCVVLSTLSFPLRTLRWRSLLRGADGGSLPLGPAWHGVAIGFMANNILPLRAGEPIRGVVVSRLGGVSLPAAWASIAVERIFDSLTLAALLVAALLAGALPPEASFSGMSAGRLAAVTAVLGAAALGAGAAVLVWPAGMARLVERLIPWPALAVKLDGIVQGIREGVSSLASPRRLATVIGWSVVIWGTSAASFLVLFPAFGIDLGLAPALIIQSAIVFSIALPSSPGFVGVFEAAIIVSLGFYGIDRDTALAYALTYHATTFVPITLLGLVSVVQTPIKWGEVKQAPTR